MAEGRVQARRLFLQANLWRVGFSAPVLAAKLVGKWGRIMRTNVMARLSRTMALTSALALAGHAAFAQGSKLRCDFYKQFGCMAQRCTDLSTQAWSTIDFDAKKYSICDKARCEDLSFVQWPDGIYVALAFPGRELMAKINLIDNSIIETSTYMLNSITSFGNCTAERNAQ